MDTSKAERKQAEWQEFATRIESLRQQGRRGLRRLSDSELSDLLDRYQGLTSDLGRARAMDAPAATVDFLNRLAVSAHGVLYGYSRDREHLSWALGWGGFARAVRSAPGAVGLAFLMFWLPALVSFLAVQMVPGVAFELVAPEFYNFDPPSAQHMHEIPSLMRPFTASSIIANNIQVTFLAFALGLSAGIGTTVVLVYNGVHIGAVAGWMSYQGQGMALLGWVLPHGSTELLAICLSGAAGYVLAGALYSPGLLTRVAALQRAGTLALQIELGCAVMLVVAGLVEGLVSPSSIGFPARLLVLGGSLGLWGAYFVWAGREPA